MSDQKHFGMDIDMKMSLGNMITIGVLLATIIAGWSTFQADLTSAKAEIGKNAIRIERLETQSGDMKDRLTRIEVTLQNMSIQIDRAVRFLERSPREADPTQSP
ncbi:hypothetical protein WHT83_15060 [Aminobacter sp. P9b]|uniref:hypothetical protein n=1 Tax=Aminobacter sp. P9b TaxID=3133697 RepID=UPI003249BDF6